jgi:hypothetical protein
MKEVEVTVTAREQAFNNPNSFRWRRLWKMRWWMRRQRLQFIAPILPQAEDGHEDEDGDGDGDGDRDDEVGASINPNMG